MCQGGIGRGDGCFVAFSRGSSFESFYGSNIFSLLLNSYFEWYHLQMDTLDELSNFIEADDIDAIILLYGECRNASIGALPEILWF